MTQPQQYVSSVGAQHAAPHLGRISTHAPGTVSSGVLLLFVLLTPTVFGDCKCRRPEKGENTHWCGNEMVVLVEKESRHDLRGTVKLQDDRLLEDVLVEVFDTPEYLLEPSTVRTPPTQKRLRACRTAADGKFCFRNLPSGKYEIRASLSSGWNVTHIDVVVDVKTDQNTEIHLPMTLGT